LEGLSKLLALLEFECLAVLVYLCFARKIVLSHLQSYFCNCLSTFYFFDGKINKDIGSSQYNRNRLFEVYELFDLLNIKQDKKYDLSYNNHATILYTLK
jgi:hypothetical protein